MRCDGEHATLYTTEEPCFLRRGAGCKNGCIDSLDILAHFWDTGQPALILLLVFRAQSKAA